MFLKITKLIITINILQDLFDLVFYKLMTMLRVDTIRFKNKLSVTYGAAMIGHGHKANMQWHQLCT